MANVKKVLMLVHPMLRPDRPFAGPGTERDIFSALKKLGHGVEVAAIRAEMSDLDKSLARYKPDIVFNLLEEFKDEGIFDFHAVSWLEALGVPYTGCNPRGLIVSRNKFWSTYIARGMGIGAPDTQLAQGQRLPRPVDFPAFIKFNREHASMAITEQNRAKSARGALKVMKKMRTRLPAEIVVQEFIAGADVSVAVLGNGRVQAFTPWQLRHSDDQDFATEKIKFDSKVRRKKGVKAARYRGEATKEMKRQARDLFRVMDLSGYARFDFRVREGQPFLVDVNANPNLAKGEDFACSARSEGWEYPELVSQILHLGIAYKPRR